MNKKHKKIMIVMTILFILVISGLAIIMLNKNQPPCEISPELKNSKNYSIPCKVIFTVSDTAPPSEDRIEQMVESVNGEIIEPRFDFGVYVISVDPGTEKETIRKLETYPEITSATRDHCCSVAN